MSEAILETEESALTLEQRTEVVRIVRSLRTESNANGPLSWTYRGDDFHRRVRRRWYALLDERTVICYQDDIMADPELQTFTGWAQPVQCQREISKFLVMDPVPFPYPSREPGQEVLAAFKVPSRRPVDVCRKSALHCAIEIAVSREHRRKRMSDRDRAQKIRRLQERYHVEHAVCESGSMP